MLSDTYPPSHMSLIVQALDVETIMHSSLELVALQAGDTLTISCMTLDESLSSQRDHFVICKMALCGMLSVIYLCNQRAVSVRKKPHR